MSRVAERVIEARRSSRKAIAGPPISRSGGRDTDDRDALSQRDDRGRSRRPSNGREQSDMSEKLAARFSSVMQVCFRRNSRQGLLSGPEADPQLSPWEWVFMPPFRPLLRPTRTGSGAESSSGSAVATRMIQIVQITVDGLHGDRACSHTCGHALHGPSAHVADCKDARALRLIG
jgi:hypothetical protein